VTFELQLNGHGPKNFATRATVTICPPKQNFVPPPMTILFMLDEIINNKKASYF
jgi:hypothetical protein